MRFWTATLVVLAMPLEPTAATFTVNSTADAGDASPGDGTCETAPANGVCTLRAAIEEANAFAGVDTIAFGIPGAPPHTIQPTSALPGLASAIVDGTTQPGFSGSPVVEIDGSLAGSADGLVLGAGNTTVRGLVINRFSALTRAAIRLVGSDGDVVEGNYLGTDVSGTLARPNRFGVLATSSGHTIGGTTPAARNVISGNDDAGVRFELSSSGNVVQGNYIGTDVTGTVALGNDFPDVWINGSSNNTIGGTSAGAGNVISADRAEGVSIGGDGNTVQANLIGTNAAGTAVLGNGDYGIVVAFGSGNTIGGTTAGAGNVIGGMAAAGILLSGGGTVGNLVQGNFIGTDPTATISLSNNLGIVVTSASGYTIGGTAAGAGNLISQNSFQGIYIVDDSSTGDAILSNAIFANGSVGILLGPSGMGGQNDTDDGDTGPNNLQNFPVLTQITVGVGTTTIEGNLNSAASTTYRIEFFANSACDPSGRGEGESLLGSSEVMTDGSGNVSFMVTFPIALPTGYAVTATATDPGNNTSEFSACATTCGNTILDAGEECDDANTLGGDCCSATCQFESNGDPCGTDGNTCTDDECDGAGVCQHLNNSDPCNDLSACTTGDTCAGGACIGAPVTCDPCLVCDPGSGCVMPTAPGCQSSSSRRGSIVLRDSSDDGMDGLTFRWRSSATTLLGDFGDPTTSTDYRLCIFDGAAGLKLSLTAPAGGTCAGAPCWRDTHTGFKYRDAELTPDGFFKIRLKPGDAGKGKILFKGRGANLGMPTLSLSTPVTVRVKRSDSPTCWEAQFSSAIRNLQTQFKARSD